MVRSCVSTLILFMMAAVAGAQENLYALGKCGGFCLLRLDPASASTLGGNLLPNYTPSTLGLTHDGERLWTISQSGFKSDTAVSIHPASGLNVGVGPTGSNWNPVAIAFDRAADKLYAINQRSLYTIHRETGHATLQVQTVSGVPASDCICSMAIDPSGQAWGMGFLSFGQNLLYKLDLDAGRATLVGEIATTTSGVYRDMAFDSNGKLWVLWHSFAYPLDSGIYTVDIQSMTKTLVKLHQVGTVWGLAFGPATVETEFCSAKTGSTGCVSTISADGVASPTATSGYTVAATNVRNNKVGMLMLSTSGRAAMPFSGGTLCLHPPLIRTQLALSGGNAWPLDDCSGSWSFDANSAMTPAKGFVAGTIVTAQWFGRDGPAGTPDNLALSDALEFTLLP